VAISGERKFEKEEKEEGYFRSERSYGSFYRLVPQPKGAKIDNVKADLNNGVLTIVVPVPEAKVTELAPVARCFSRNSWQLVRSTRSAVTVLSVW
jgi:HSP20 family protein